MGAPGPRGRGSQAPSPHFLSPMEGIGMKVTNADLMMTYGQLLKWNTKPLTLLTHMLQDELGARRVASYKAPRIDDRPAPLVGQPSGDTNAT